MRRADPCVPGLAAAVRAPEPSRRLCQSRASGESFSRPGRGNRIPDAIGKALEEAEDMFLATTSAEPGLASVMWLTFPMAATVGSGGIRS
jgi:hypothetical protein